MPFVKLDCGMLDSSLWIDREAREIFVTALLMARPYEAKDAMKQIAIRDLSLTGFEAPSGWYGFVEASCAGLLERAKIAKETGLGALERLGNMDPDSRTPDHDGRRLLRVNGGFLVVNYQKYRDRDYTAADRQKRFREKRLKSKNSNAVTVTHNAVTSRNITQAEAEAEAYQRETPAPRPAGWPSTEAQARAMATTAGVDEEIVATIWHEHEAGGTYTRTDQQGNAMPIRNFASYITTRCRWRAHRTNETKTIETHKAKTCHATYQPNDSKTGNLNAASRYAKPPKS